MFGFLHFGNKFNKRRVVASRREDIEPNEIFYDRIVKTDRDRADVVDRSFEISLPSRSLRMPFILACVLFLATALRVAALQVIDGKDYSSQAAENKYLFHRVQSDRGIIYDNNFNPLLENQSTFDLECVKSKMPADEKARKMIVASLAAAVNVNAADLAALIESGKNPLVESLGHQALIVLEARIADFPGCAITRRAIRNYVRDSGLSHLLGYMGKIEPDEWRSASENYSINDYIGRSGLEKYYEGVLRKNPGQLRIERDAKGNIVNQNVAVSPQSGDSLRLWLDMELQKKLYNTLKNQLAGLDLKKASAVALNPKTGGILAMVSFPDYDNNVFAAGVSDQVRKLFDDKDNPLFNRVISGRYLTGSTIKPLEAAAALQEKIISPDKNINCQGKLVVQNKYNPEIFYTFNDNHVHGSTNMYKAIAESCNAYFQTIGGGYGDQQGLGPARIKKYLELFGWGEPTGVDLPGETSGFVPDQAWKKEKFSGTQDQAWGDGDTYNLAIGQGFIGITPLEVANAYAAIANGGILFKPQMVQSVVGESRNIVEEKKPQIIRENFIDPKNLEAVRVGMRHGVNGAGAPLASALTLNSLPVPVAAKTGTAQLRKGSDGKDLLNAWVGAFAPYDDPQIVIVVMAEDVHEGTVAVVPVAKEILRWYFEPKDENGVRLSEIATTTAETASSTETLPEALPEDGQEPEPAVIPEE